MTQPKARCVTCGEIIQNHDTHNTQKPLYCEDPMCRFLGRQKRRCARPGCKDPRPLVNPHPSTKYHPKCKDGCHWCGGELLARTATRHRASNTTLDSTYCSEDCRNAAWSGQPMPTCPGCHEPVDFTPNVQAWRDPPAWHHWCRPDSKKVKRRTLSEKMDQEEMWNHIATMRTLPGYIPDPPDPKEPWRRKRYYPFLHADDTMPPEDPVPPQTAALEWDWASREEIIWANEHTYGPYLRPLRRDYLPAEDMNEFEKAVRSIAVRIGLEMEFIQSKKETEALLQAADDDDFDGEYIPEDWE